MNWIYSGSTFVSTPAVGTSLNSEGFSWGGSVHVLYTYNEVPEPSTLALGVVGLLAGVGAGRRRLSATKRKG